MSKMLFYELVWKLANSNQNWELILLSIFNFRPEDLNAPDFVPEYAPEDIDSDGKYHHYVTTV